MIAFMPFCKETPDGGDPAYRLIERVIWRADSAAHAILGKEASIAVDFSRAKGAASQSRIDKATRFPINPEANWGPMRKHTRQV